MRAEGPTWLLLCLRIQKQFKATVSQTLCIASRMTHSKVPHQMRISSCDCLGTATDAAGYIRLSLLAMHADIVTVPRQCK